MTRYTHIRQATHSILDSATWSISEPDRWERIRLQLTCQDVVLESDWVHLEYAKATKIGMERMCAEIIFNQNSSGITIRRKAG